MKKALTSDGKNSGSDELAALIPKQIGPWEFEWAAGLKFHPRRVELRPMLDLLLITPYWDQARCPQALQPRQLLHFQHRLTWFGSGCRK